MLQEYLQMQGYFICLSKSSCIQRLQYFATLIQMFLSFCGKTFALSAENSIKDQIQNLLLQWNACFSHFTFYSSGKRLEEFDHLPLMSTIIALVPLKGGKGGYGAKLKTEGGKKVRPNDNMFSRDTHGQKLVYSTQEKQYKEFIKKKIEEDKVVARQREQFKIMESTLREGQSFMKLDQAYKKEVEATEKNLIESIMIGKQRLKEKYKIQEKKIEERNEQIKVQSDQTNSLKLSLPLNEQLKQEIKDNQEEKACKRTLPNDFKQVYEGFPQKKVKIEPPQAKPSFLSAQERFKLLFKK